MDEYTNEEILERIEQAKKKAKPLTKKPKHDTLDEDDGYHD